MTTPTDTPNSGIGLDAAADRISSLFDPAPGTEEEKPTPPGAEPDAEPSDETPTPEKAAEPEEEAADTANDADDDEQPAPATYTVKIDGQEVEVPADELVKGYQRQSDYTRKTQQLSEQRRAFEAEANAVRQEREQYAVLLNDIAGRLKATESPEPDWQALAAASPQEAFRQKLAWDQREKMKATVEAEQRALSARQAAEAQRQQAEMLQEAHRYLAENLPEWSDPKKRTAEQTALREYGLKAGYTAEELASVVDPRAIVILRKARLYDEAVTAKPKPVAPAVQTQASPKPLTPGQPPAPNARKTTDLTRAKQRLAQSGSVEDAALVLSRIL